MNENVISVIKQVKKLWQPPTDLTVSQWADEKRILSAEASAEPGKWQTGRAEYQRGIMDAFSDPDVLQIVAMTSAQIGKSEVVNNIVGFFADQDPSPILVLQPTVDMAQTWSKDRLAPMLRDTPCLKDKVKDARSRDSGNTILHKSFPGGHITAVGANSAAGLASRPIRVVLCDEVDRYPASAGSEGDPVNLAIKRSTTYWNKKICLVSTPTTKGLSRIESAYEASDKRRYYVPCPKCGAHQTLIWGQVKWDKDENKKHLPNTAYYECAECQEHLTDADLIDMVRHGEWIAEEPFNGIAGFHLNELYSPWKTISEIVKDFLSSYKEPEKFKTWVNTSLGETFEEQGETVNDNELMARCEEYKAQVPQGGLVLTCGVDVQRDRVEIETVAWGLQEESWSVDYRVIPGKFEQQEIRQYLDDYLDSDFKHESGVLLKISTTCIDSGDQTQDVYEYVRKRSSKRIFAVKGVGGKGQPIAGTPSNIRIKKTKRGVRLYPVGTDQAKCTIYGRLKIEDAGPGYMHFPNTYDKSYFEMLTAEKLVTKFKKGFQTLEWIKIRARNEVLDLRVYALAGLKILNPNFEKIKTRLIKESIKKKIEALREKVTGKKTSELKKEVLNKKPKPKKGNFAKNWRY